MGGESTRSSIRWAAWPTQAVLLGLLVLLLFGCQGKSADKPTPTAKEILPAADAIDSVAANSREEDSIQSVLAGETPTLLLELPPTERFWTNLDRLNGGLLDLMLDAGGVHDDELSRLGVLESIEHLRIRLSPITDAGIEQFVGSGDFSNLQILNLPHAKVTADGIRLLAKLPKLRQLRLGGAQIDNAAVAEIAKLPNLRSLHLIDPDLTGDALGHLGQARTLASFYLDGCELPDEAWIGLFEAKPNLHVHIDQNHHDHDPAGLDH